MHTLNFSILINAPKEKVWEAMLSDAGYREWTAPFNAAGSYFKGDWSKGSKMLFIGVDGETGSEDGGMYSEIVENRPNEYVSMKHLGMIEKGVEVPWPDSNYEGFENYTLTDKDGGTEVLVELINIPDEWAQMMNDMWPKALLKLKEITER